MVCAMVFSNSFVVKSAILIISAKNEWYICIKNMQFCKVLSICRNVLCHVYIM